MKKRLLSLFIFSKEFSDISLAVSINFMFPLEIFFLTSSIPKTKFPERFVIPKKESRDLFIF